MLLNIRALQALAAYCVVLVHLLDSWNNYTGAHFNYPISINGGFNSLFFVMSGFLIARSTKGRDIRPTQFFVRRLVRILPLYWGLTAIVFASTLLGLRTLGLQSPDLSRFLLSLSFLPAFENGHSVSPILFVGWTLNYQVFAYLLFALALTLRPVAPDVVGFSILIAAVSAISYAVDWPELGYFSDEILLGFLFGALLSRIDPAAFPITGKSAPYPLGAAVIAGVLFLLWVTLLLTGPLVEHKHGLLAVACTLIVFGATGLEANGIVIRSRMLLRQGEASYSIFLIHPMVLQLTGKAMILTGLNATVAGTLAGYVGSIVAVGFAGRAVHTFVDKPVNVVFNGFAAWRDRPSAPAHGA